MRAVCIAVLSTLCSAVAAPVPLPVVDLSADASGDVIVAAGTEEAYQGHPTTVRTVDGRILAVWCTPHGGHCGPAAESADGGKTWTRIDGRFPKGYSDHVNCPSAYRLVGPDGKARLWVWSQSKRRDTDKPGDDWTCRQDVTRAMPSVASEDEGRTWREMPALGEKFACVMAFSFAFPSSLANARFARRRRSKLPSSFIIARPNAFCNSVRHVPA